MPKIFHEPHKTAPAHPHPPPSYILDVQSLTCDSWEELVKCDQ